MNLKNEVKNRLKEHSDESYIEFSKGLAVGNDECKRIGVRIPILRKYAKELSKKYELEFLIEIIDEEYYEELLLKGILIGEYSKLEWSELEKYIRYFVPRIYDWCLCDTFCSCLKIAKRYPREIWVLIQEYLKSSKEFEVRFALVIILNYYINEEYIERIFEVINSVNLDKYYVKMANAWLISYCVIKEYDKTMKFLKENCKVDSWTYNKGIQKSMESYRVSPKNKEELRKLR
jgi:3-methyladenine DNA glycosylase AlkD